MNGEKPLCRHHKRRILSDYGSVRILLCEQCGLAFSDRYPEGFDPRDVYDDFYQNEIPVRFRGGIEFIIRMFRLFRAFKISMAVPYAKSILDVGSGTGYLLYYLKKYFGYTRTAGTQLSERAYRFSRDHLGLEIYNRDLLELPMADESFDLVTMFHVLEHVAEPQSYLRRIHGLLKKGGRLVIEVPNFRSWSRPLTGRYWLGLDLDHHLSFFTPESLTGLLRKYGFSILKVHTFSLEYSPFISVQSLVSFLTLSDGLFFNALLSGRFKGRSLLHGLLILLLAPLGLFVNLSLYFTRCGEVLLVLARKN